MEYSHPSGPLSGSDDRGLWGLLAAVKLETHFLSSRSFTSRELIWNNQPRISSPRVWPNRLIYIEPQTFGSFYQTDGHQNLIKGSKKKRRKKSQQLNFHNIVCQSYINLNHLFNFATQNITKSSHMQPSRPAGTVHDKVFAKIKLFSNHVNDFALHFTYSFLYQLFLCVLSNQLIVIKSNIKLCVYTNVYIYINITSLTIYIYI